VTSPAESGALSPDARRDALVSRLFEAAITTMEACTVYLGDRLGLYAALNRRGPSTAAELAAATGTHSRYVREWLEQQAVAGILAADGAVDAEARRYRLPPGHAEVLLDADSLNCVSPVLRLVVGLMAPLPEVLRAFRTGDGVPWSAYGEDGREGQAGGECSAADPAGNGRMSRGRGAKCVGWRIGEVRISRRRGRLVRRGG
jgi:hypothetical protein